MPYDEGNRMWKVQVYDKQGRPSGLLKLARFEEEENGEEFLHWNDKRRWTGRPREQHWETLLQWEFTDGTAYYLLIHYGQELTEDDYVRERTQQNAANWLLQEGYDLPDELRGLNRVAKNAPDNDTASSPQRWIPLTSSQQEVWDLLEHQALTAKELAAKVLGSPGSEESIRKRIAAIRASGRLIENRRGLGYYRPDTPPDGRT